MIDQTGDVGSAASEEGRAVKGALTAEHGAPRDPAQVKRIEAVHRGFLYQHLYAVGCLLTCGREQATTILVERDEDIEVICPAERTYIQVKTRQRPLQFGDIETALSRFGELRRLHEVGDRPGKPRFLVIANSERGAGLQERLALPDWPQDVGIIAPSDGAFGRLPPAFIDIDSAVAWCVEKAKIVPFGSLPPETLVWKLAAKVLRAASNAAAASFQFDDMPSLLEQLVVQLQDFPNPPARYRPQLDEPPLIGEQRIRLLTGFSGAGKTAWASHCALHCPQNVAYLQVGAMPAASIANALARELAARFAGGAGQGLSAGMFAESAGLDVLRACAKELERKGIEVTVVIDDAHRMDANAIRDLVDAARELRFVLIGQPWEDQARVEALLGIRAGHLSGWSLEDIAAEFRDKGAAISLENAAVLRNITAGLPLYVRGAAELAAIAYGGDAGAMCNDLVGRTNGRATPQEVILEEVFGRLDAKERQVTAIFGLSDVPLACVEVDALLGLLDCAGAAGGRVLRRLERLSIVVGYPANRVGLHDALRPLAKDARAELPDGLERRALEQLVTLFIASLHKQQDIPRLNALIRLLPKIGKSDALVDLATDEMFHEQGDQTALRIELELAAANPTSAPRDRFWAHDAMAYWESRDGGRPSDRRLRQMREFVDGGVLGTAEELALVTKEIIAAGFDGDRQAVERAFDRGMRRVASRSLETRLLRYDRLVALFRIGEHVLVERLIEPLIDEYFSVIGIRETDEFLKTQAELFELLPKPIANEDLKRLADCLSLWCQVEIALGKPPIWKVPGRAPAVRRISAMKFYTLAHAGRSAAQTGLEAVDDFIELYSDPEGARSTMEQHVLPLIKLFHLTDMLLHARSVYAMVLAWCGAADSARREMAQLALFGGSEEQQQMLAERSRAIDLIASGQSRLGGETRRNALGEALKIGLSRNDPCFCGSGKKFKRCHGAA